MWHELGLASEETPTGTDRPSIDKEQQLELESKNQPPARGRYKAQKQATWVLSGTLDSRGA